MFNLGMIIGSIGVILWGNNIECFLEKVGVFFKVVKFGFYKDILVFDWEMID